MLVMRRCIGLVWEEVLGRVTVGVVALKVGKQAVEASHCWQY